MNTQHTPGPVIAPDHKGIRVDYSRLLGQVQRILALSNPGYAEMLRQLQEHMKVLGRRYYAGDAACVDEFLQLYFVEHDARCAAIAKAAQPSIQHLGADDTEGGAS